MNKRLVSGIIYVGVTILIFILGWNYIIGVILGMFLMLLMITDIRLKYYMTKLKLLPDKTIFDELYENDKNEENKKVKFKS